MPASFVVTAAKWIFFTMKGLFKVDHATKLASVELWVVMTTLLLVVRFLIDFSGPFYSNAFPLAMVQIIELLNYNMVHYTLGLMQLSAARVNDFFQVWAVLMVTLQYSVKIGRPYGRSKRIPLLDLMSSFWAANLLRVQTVFLLKIPLWCIWSINAGRIIAYFLFSDRSVTRNRENTRLVCDYMMYEHTLSETTNTNSMTGYKYFVLGEDQQEKKLDLGKFRLKFDVEHTELVTLEKVWGLHDSGLLGKTTDPNNQLKDVCLSFALYKLLHRRFYNLPIYEAEHDKTKKLVFEGLLDEKDDYERVFRVTGVELSFLQDLYHSKHAQMFASGFPFHSLVLSLVLVAVTGYIAIPVRQIPHRIDPADLKRNGITRGVFITCFIVGLIIVKEMAEIMMYVFSQWTKVQMICMHIKCPRFGRCWLVVRAMRCMFRLIKKGKWKQKICQYNILISCHKLKVKMDRFFPTSINLETEVKKAILQSFKGLDKNPERLEAYFSNAFASKGDLMQQLEWSIDLEADTHRLLVWHIATCLCEINLSDDVTKELKTIWLKPRPFVNRSSAPEDVWEHYMTASSLSNYCGYLLMKALLPDNGLVVRRVFFSVRGETNRAIPIFGTLFDIFESLMKKAGLNEEADEEEPVTMGDDTILTEKFDWTEDDGEHYEADALVNEEDPENVIKGDDDDEDTDTIIKMGTRLGKQLMDMYQADKVGLWEDLAKFWTGFLLHLAANTGANFVTIIIIWLCFEFITLVHIKSQVNQVQRR
uniref:Uncharacterized protein n=1 Tax=Avena sativa TaxID=4498 RepID=A0ACD5V987_AVESA